MSRQQNNMAASITKPNIISASLTKPNKPSQPKPNKLAACFTKPNIFIQTKQHCCFLSQTKQYGYICI